MPHIIRKPEVPQGIELAFFLAFVHMVNEVITTILGALWPTLRARFDASITLIDLIVHIYSIALLSPIEHSLQAIC